MRLEYHAPRQDLRDFVRAYYLFETDAPLRQPMCAELANVRFVLSGGGSFILPDGRIAPASSGNLAGPTLGAFALDAAAGTRVFGIGILPRGWPSLFGVDASELADDIVDLTAIGGKIASSALEEISNAPGLAEMADAADRFFATLLTRRRRSIARYPDALEHWLLEAGDVSLDALLARMDLSGRQTERLAKTFYGASPKLLQRKYRVLRAADRILFDGARRWTDAAGDRFYDQSHFIREFKTFVGATPRDFAENAQAQSAKALSAHVQRERRYASPRLAGL